MNKPKIKFKQIGKVERISDYCYLIYGKGTIKYDYSMGVYIHAQLTNLKCPECGKYLKIDLESLSIQDYEYPNMRCDSKSLKHKIHEDKKGIDIYFISDVKNITFLDNGKKDSFKLGCKLKKIINKHLKDIKNNE
jgi:hypothetical protein